MPLATEIFHWKDPKSRSFNYLPTGISRTVRKSKLFPTFLSQKNGVDDKKNSLSNAFPFILDSCMRPILLRKEWESKTGRKWLSFHFTCGQDLKSRFSVFLCSESKQKRLLRRLCLIQYQRNSDSADRFVLQNERFNTSCLQSTLSKKDTSTTSTKFLLSWGVRLNKSKNKLKEGKKVEK